ncbi:FAD-binding protein [Adlercreutzia sp. ZJ473]|uniref:FAD-binding protein n=1 Tax=Adlercreutzia sp. ZJ473 TaxID=2722822 RepID=UPI001553932C
MAPDGTPTSVGLTFEANDGMIAQNIEMGIIQQADTIEELAEKLLMPADALKATVDRYNELCEKGEDEDFGKESKDMLALTTPPFCGAYFGGHVLCTIDGLQIDEHGRVLTAEQDPIPGLYAVGNCSGSIYNGSYPELFIGNANGRTITFGRHAVRHILGEI